MDPIDDTEWSIIERRDDTIVARGPEGYIRLRLTPFGPKPVDKWKLSVNVDGEFVKRGETLTITHPDQLQDAIESEIETIRADGYG